MAANLQWDAQGEHWYQTGIDKVALYVWDTYTEGEGSSATTYTGYGKPIAWNGVTALNESPSGAESNKLYANNHEYLNLISAEEFACTLEAYQSPEAFDECDGEAGILSTITGLTNVKIKVHGARRKKFALAWRVLKGNDADMADAGAIGDNATNKYVYHIAYGCTAAPTAKDNSTVNDSPEAVTLSWEIDTIPIVDTASIGTDLIGAGVSKVAHLEFEVSTAAEAAIVEDILYDNTKYCPRPVDFVVPAN